jgi:hypothetical protein
MARNCSSLLGMDISLLCASERANPGFILARRELC